MPNTVRPGRAAVARSLAAASAAALGAACASGSASSAPPPTAIRQQTTVIETSSGASYELRTSADDRAVDATFRTTPDRLWAVLPTVYDSLGIRLTTLDAPRRTLGAQNARVRRRLAGQAVSRSLGCGNGVTGEDNADSYDVYLTVLSAVEPAGADGAVLRTWVQGSARPTGSSGDAVRCGSTGWLERRIAEVVGAGVAR